MLYTYNIFIKSINNTINVILRVILCRYLYTSTYTYKLEYVNNVFFVLRKKTRSVLNYYSKRIKYPIILYGSRDELRKPRHTNIMNNTNTAVNSYIINKRCVLCLWCRPHASSMSGNEFKSNTKFMKLVYLEIIDFGSFGISHVFILCR